MSQYDLLRQISRLMSEISTTSARIREAVYRKAWNRGEIEALERELVGRRRELDELRAEYARRHHEAAAADSAAGGGATDGTTDGATGGPTVTVQDARLLANALYTQRPLPDQSDEWPVFRRVCASLVRLLAREVAATGGEEFDPLEFLTHCGLEYGEAEQIAARPGEFARPSDESLLRSLREDEGGT